MSTLKNYVNIEAAEVVVVQTFPDHAGNTEDVIGAREVGSDGQGPAFFAPRDRLGDNQLEAIRLARPDLASRHVEIQESIQDLQREGAKIVRLLKLSEG